MNDLPGQQVLFPDMEQRATPDDTGDAIAVLSDGLPPKETINCDEAAKLLNVCRRLVDYYVKDGTLLAIYANRKDETQRRHARIVVRASRPYDPERKNFLTLAELRIKRSNVGGN